jgi:MIP family channel proteins
MSSLPRKLVAEALGTFMLVFFGCASIVMTAFPGGNWGVLGVALAHGLVLSVAVTATMAISGGHLNPAVTLGLAAMRRVTPVTAVAYIAAQLVGAVLGAAVLKALVPGSTGSAVMYGAPAVNGTLSLATAVGVEALLTFVLMSAYYGTVIAHDKPPVAGFGIGLTWVFALMAGGALTGAALNPARAFGPAVVSGHWVAHIVWWIGPIVGALAAAVVWEFVLLEKKS